MKIARSAPRPLGAPCATVHCTSIWPKVGAPVPTSRHARLDFLVDLLRVFAPRARQKCGYGLFATCVNGRPGPRLRFDSHWLLGVEARRTEVPLAAGS